MDQPDLITITEQIGCSESILDIQKKNKKEETTIYLGKCEKSTHKNTLISTAADFKNPLLKKTVIKTRALHSNKTVHQGEDVIASFIVTGLTSDKSFVGLEELFSRSGPWEPSLLLWLELLAEVNRGTGEANWANEAVIELPSPYICPCKSGAI